MRWRGAYPGAPVWQGGLSSDAWHPTAPPTDAEGAVRAMREALARAHLTPADIAYVNAHGTGTVQNDRAEAVALANVFGPGNVLVSLPNPSSGIRWGRLERWRPWRRLAR